MATESAELKNEQIPPQEDGGDDEVRGNLRCAAVTAQKLRSIISKLIFMHHANKRLFFFFFFRRKLPR